jgi:hypothetical protein
MDEIYWDCYYIWINPTFWSLLVIFLLSVFLSYALNVVTRGWWVMVGICIITICILGGIIISAVNVVQILCGISPRFLSEFDYIARASWIDNIFWGCVGLVAGTMADYMMVIRD